MRWEVVEEIREFHIGDIVRMVDPLYYSEPGPFAKIVNWMETNPVGDSRPWAFLRVTYSDGSEKFPPTMFSAPVAKFERWSR